MYHYCYFFKKTFEVKLVTVIDNLQLVSVLRNCPFASMLVSENSNFTHLYKPDCFLTLLIRNIDADFFRKPYLNTTLKQNHKGPK